MEPLRYSKEEFGYLVVFPDGSIDLYDKSVEPLLSTTSAKTDLESHVLKTFAVAGNFHLARPLIVWFEVTRRCNLTCTHCYIDAGRPRPNELTFDEVVAFIDDLKALGAFSLGL